MYYLLSLLLIPLIGILVIFTRASYGGNLKDTLEIKYIGLVASVINLLVSLLIFILFDFSGKQFQFIQLEEQYNISYFDLHLGIDGISIYFILLTTIIMPISLISN
jgi:NADH:ubiquinone oxidoreductase subunit 4 (subunit M)